MMTARIFVLGFVQGVGYRAFIKKNAQKLNLTGVVRNLPDGRVEVLAQGAKENIQKLIKLCEKGPFFSEVKSIVVDWDGEGEYKSFEIT